MDLRRWFRICALMTSAGYTPDLLRVLRSERVLVPLLVLTLLVCHGILGGVHQPLHSPAAMEHSAHAGFPVEEGSGIPEGDLGSVSYAAALFFALAASFWLLLGGLRWRSGSVPRSSYERRWPDIPCRSRGPTVALLQVFRL
jgi:hypothetical protein